MKRVVVTSEVCWCAYSFVLPDCDPPSLLLHRIYSPGESLDCESRNPKNPGSAVQNRIVQLSNSLKSQPCEAFLASHLPLLADEESRLADWTPERSWADSRGRERHPCRREG